MELWVREIVFHSGTTPPRRMLAFNKLTPVAVRGDTTQASKFFILE